MAKKPKTTIKSQSGMLSRTKLYGFELFMATIGLLATAFVVDYGIFSLFRHFSQDLAGYQGNDQVAIFLVAALIVWLPVATFFYLRVRGELQASPNNVYTKVHKVVMSIYMVINTIIVIGALFYTVYASLELFIGTNPGSTNPFMRQILPGLLMAIWHGWMLIAFTRVRLVTRRMFPASFTIITIIVVLLLFAVKVGGIRAQAIDQQRESDLSAIQDAVNRYYNETGLLPSNLEALEAPKLQNNLDDYTYSKTSEVGFKLCAEFLLNTTGSQLEYGVYSSGGYTEYPVWSDHISGTQCYKINPIQDEYDISR